MKFVLLGKRSRQDVFRYNWNFLIEIFDDYFSNFWFPLPLHKNKTRHSDKKSFHSFTYSKRWKIAVFNPPPLYLGHICILLQKFWQTLPDEFSMGYSSASRDIDFDGRNVDIQEEEKHLFGKCDVIIWLLLWEEVSQFDFAKLSGAENRRQNKKWQVVKNK